MPSQATQLQLKALQRRCAALRNRAGQLLNARNTACRQLLLLEALCDCFATFTALSKNELGLEGSRCPADFDELMQHEQELLSQLQRVQDGAELEVLELLGAADAGVATIAPRTDPLALLKRHLSLARAENVVSLTPKDVAELYSSTVQEFSVQLRVLQTHAPELQATAAARLEELGQRYLHTLVSLLLGNQYLVLEHTSMINMETGMPDEEAVSKHAALVAAVPRALDLTEQQMQEICAGTALFGTLLGNLQRDRCQHQLELSCQDSWPPGMVISTSSSDSCDSSSSGSCLPSTLHQLHRDLAGHQRSKGRLHVLLRKDYWISAAGVSWLVGCLTWQQLIKAMVMCWPYTLRTMQLAQAITLHAQECKPK